MFNIDGGAYVKFILNGHDADGGNQYGQIPVGGFSGSFVPELQNGFLIGENTICVMVYSANPDSTTHFCSDTVCRTLTIENCCDSFHAVLYSLDTAYCLGTTDSVYYGGGKYGRFLIHLMDQTYVGDITPTNGIVGDVLVFNGNDVPLDSIIQICFVAYSENPDSNSVFCTDTICMFTKVKKCLCDSLVPQMDIKNNGDGTYTLSSKGSPTPTILKWFVDGTPIVQTTGYQPYVYKDVKIGKHIICMEAAYITPIGNGLSECCYITVCDSSFDYDNCDVWRATDSISYSLDPNNINHVSFQYYGTAQPTSIQWDFGDGSATEVNAGNIDHTYASDGNYQVCAYIVWSVGGNPNCCCVDTICFDIDISVCRLANIHVEPADTTVDGYIFKLVWDNTTSIQYANWFGDVTGTGTTSDPLQPTYDGTFNICVGVKYSVWYQGKAYGCGDKICNSYTLTGKYPSSGMRFYPNPAKNSITVEIINYTEAQKASLSIIDMTGRTIEIREINNLKQGANPVYLNIDKLQKGIYQLQFKMGDNIHQVEKLIKE
jgi:hypothetical protein